ncbi:MAG: LpxL/LpxP family acyltransferase [Promethearchaeota archaeon]
MAQLFLADKGSTRRESIARLEGKKTDAPEGNVREKKAEQSWGDTMGGILKFIKWMGRYKIYRIGKYRSDSALNAWGHLLGKLMFGTSSKIKRRTMASLRALYPNASKKKLEKFYDTNNKFMGMFFLDMIFRMPFMCDFPPHAQVDVMKYLNFEVLDKVLEEGKGAIILILHLGQHFHNPGGMFLHPNKYQMDVVASVKNLPMYEANNRAHFNNLHIYASTKFSQISEQLKRGLQKNHILVMYHDYSSKTQLKTPFIAGKLPFLISTPQSYIRLHKLTGAPILPLITVPDKNFGRSKLFFVDNTSIMDISQKYWDAPKEEFHGQVSTEINRIMFPWVHKYGPWWEELMRVAGLRSKDELKFDPNCNLQTMLSTIQGKMLHIIENSWEPGRKSAELKQWITDNWSSILKALDHSEKVVRTHKTIIKLSIMTSREELEKLALVFAKELRTAEEFEARKHIKKFYDGLGQFYP